MKKQILICDRCKEDITESGEVIMIKNKAIDLCYECSLELQEFMEIKDDERGFI